MLLQTTADGSHTLFDPEIDESYHSIHGAIQESTYVFIEQGLRVCELNTIRVLEIGFGTGLNALLTSLEACRAQKRIHYTTLELYPVSEKQIRLLNYPELLEKCGDMFIKIYQATWEKDVEINPYFILHKVQTDFTTCSLSGVYDVVYFDSFSPEKQPEMWEESGFRKIAEQCNPDAILTTYCAKGSVRRILQKVGFRIERLPGPPGKKEILRARKIIR